MFNIKWGIIPGVAAFVLALMVSLFSTSSFATALLRALVFAAVFFALGCGIRMLINNFIPELLSPDTQNDAVTDLLSMNAPGSRVDISLEDTSNAALPDDNSDEVGNMADLVSGAIKAQSTKKDIDQNFASGYTDKAVDFSIGSSVTDASDGVKDGSPYDGAPSYGEPLNGVPQGGQEGLFADFGNLMPNSAEDSFSLANDGGIFDNPVDSLPERRAAGNKPMKMEGDFSPKEIAAGLRTVLDKDKKG